MTRKNSVVAGALLAGALVLFGCSDDSDAGHNGSMVDSHGESTSTSTGEDAAFDDADVAFAREMIPHHMQAVDMARMAEDRAEDPRVLDLAARIEAAQQPEIETLTGWLQDWGVAGGGTGGMDHGGMEHGAGMMSEKDMSALMAATGAEFDRLFLQLMIQHHAGAVEMADTEIADGENADAMAMAETIRDTQNAEIEEMEQLLTDLGG